MHQLDVRSPAPRLASKPGRTEQLGRPDLNPLQSASKPRILTVLPCELRQRFERSILGREDLDTRHVTDLKAAMQIVHLRPPALLVLYDSGFGELSPVLDRLQRSFPHPSFTVIVLAELPGERYPNLVTTAMPVDLDPADLSTEVARALGLATRTRRRHLIRLGVRLDDAGTSVVGNTVDLSVSGMLLECGRRLQVGALYQVAFLGQRRPPVLGLRLVRQAESTHPNLLRYAGVFEDVDHQVVENLIRQLAG